MRTTLTSPSVGSWVMMGDGKFLMQTLRSIRYRGSRKLLLYSLRFLVLIEAAPIVRMWIKAGDIGQRQLEMKASCRVRCRRDIHRFWLHLSTAAILYWVIFSGMREVQGARHWWRQNRAIKSITMLLITSRNTVCSKGRKITYS